MSLRTSQKYDNTKLQIQEVQRTQNTINIKKVHLDRSSSNCMEPKTTENSWSQAGEKKTPTYGRTSVRVTADLSEKKQARGNCNT